MTDARTLQNNFNAGELSPLIRGRVDQARYFNGLDTCLNFVPLIPGGLRVRGGFKYAGACKSNSANSYLFPFVISASTVYVLEFANNVIRFWKYDANGEPTQITSGGNPVEVTTTYTTAQIPNIQVAPSADVLFIVHPSHPPRKLSHVSDTSWLYVTLAFVPPATHEPKLAPATTCYASAATGTGLTFTAGAAAFLAGDVGRDIVANDGARARMTGFTNTTTMTGDVLEGSFAVVASPYAAAAWWFTGSPSSTLVATAPFMLGKISTIDAYASPGGVGQDTFRAGDVGSWIHMLGGSGIITAVNTAQQVSVRLWSLFNDGAATPTTANSGQWTLEINAWDDTSQYPAAIALGEQRLWFAGAAGEPDMVRATVTGDYYNFSPGTAADDALAYVFGTEGQVSVAIWLHFWRGLVLGTAANEITIKGSTDAAMAPRNPLIAPQTTYGSEVKFRQRIGNGLIFVERGGGRVRDLIFDFVTDAYDADDLTEFSDHLTWTYTFTDGAYAKAPDNLLCFLRSDGTLCVLTFSRKEKVIGWSRHTLATGAGASTINSVCTVPNPVKKRDELWITVTRTINAATVRYVEVWDRDRFLDCSIKGSGAATATITGLSHLAAESVIIRATGNDGIERLYPAQTVTGNQVTGLSPTVTAWEVGIGFTATAVTRRAELPGQTTMQAKIKGFGEIVLRCLNMPVLSTGGVRFKAKGLVSGYTAGSVFVIPTGSAAISTATADGDLVVPKTGYDRDGRVTFTQDLPLGGTVTMLEAEVSVGE